MRTPRLPKTNGEQLGWGEWFRAVHAPQSANMRELHKAWKRGEDPTEWRAHFERERTARDENA